MRPALPAHSTLTLRFSPEPIDPRAQREAGIAEVVKMEFYIDRDGSVQLPRAVSHQNEALAWSAATALARWRFDPPLRDGKPATVKVRIPMEFSLPEPTAASESAVALP